jgi:hypothetical protein
MSRRRRGSDDGTARVRCRRKLDQYRSEDDSSGGSGSVLIRGILRDTSRARQNEVSRLQEKYGFQVKRMGDRWGSREAPDCRIKS